MSNPYVGEIRMFGGNFAPAGWALCQGQLLPISENDVLFNLIGTTYGGDGQETFGLPDLQGRIPLHQGSGFTIGQLAGVESVTLSLSQIPQHPHTMVGSNDQGSSNAPGNAVLASTPTAAQAFPYGTDPPRGSIDPSSIQPSGGNQPHENMQPFLCINFIISLFGIYPPPN
jgi:microcystin-dependent protein